MILILIFDLVGGFLFYFSQMEFQIDRLQTFEGSLFGVIYSKRVV
jgi:hypothetical protein